MLRAGQGQQLRDLIFRKEGETDVDREAYVQLVFRKLAEDEEDLDDDGDDVDDYETMTFRRKITSSGASEYKVNGKTVSWDRYSDALGEIGVNVKSRRFLVFQGDVESIAGMAPKDLTTYFEKASGSDELKREYDAADAARSESEENYLFHFQKKKGMAAEKKQIKEQQEEANKYKQLKETLEQKTVEHFLYELFHVQESVQNLETEIEGHIEELDAKEAERQQVEAKMKEAKKQQSVLQRQATLHSKKIVDMEKELSKQQPNEVSLKEGIKRLAKRSTKHLKQQAKLEGELETQQSLLQELRRSLESVRHDQDEFEKSAKESASKAIQLEESQIQEYHQRKEEAGAQTVKLQQQLDQVARSLQAEKDKRSGLDVELQAQTNKSSVAESDRDHNGGREKTVSEKCKALKAKINTDRAALQSLREAAKERCEKEKDANQRLEEANKQLQEAKADRRASDKDRKLAEAVEAMQRHYPGVYGRIIDLCKPTQRKFNLAVTVAMGRHMDAVVVATEAAALDCVQYLKQQRLASATFIPLDTIQVKPVGEEARRLPQNCKLVLDVINYEPELEKAIVYAVGTAVVMESLDEARSFAYNAPREKRRKTVTTDGTMIHKSGLMTGGTTGDKSGLHFKASRWDQKQYDGLKRKRNVALADLSELNRTRPEPGTEETLAAEIDGQARQLKLNTKDLELTADNKRKAEESLGEISASIKKHTQLLKSVDKSIAKLNAQIGGIKKKIGEKEDSIFADFNEQLGVESFREYEETILRVQEENMAKRSQFAEQVLKLENQVKYEEQRDMEGPLSQLNRTIKEEEKDIISKEKKMAVLTKKRDDTTAKISEIKSEEKEAQEGIEEADVRLKELKAESREKQKECKSLAKTVSAIGASRTQLGTQRHDALVRCMVEEVALPRLATGKRRRGSGGAAEPVTTKMDAVDPGSEEQDELFEAENELAKTFDYSAVRDAYAQPGGSDFEKVHRQFTAETKEIAVQMEQLAPNLKAVDRMADVTHRLGEVVGQFDDAKGKSSEAGDAFSEIKSRRHQKFVQTFNPVSQQIDSVYKQLTVSATHPLGGTAYLSTDNAEEPYLHPVKYNAMPPNKRFRDMDQLSGGEKTVASLALLFAVHSVQPSPFFVLDEVDAALDNANVVRVADYICQHKTSFQSIVISLKDTFYHRADAVIGIYRDTEHGCSRVLSMDLSKYA